MEVVGLWTLEHLALEADYRRLVYGPLVLSFKK